MQPSALEVDELVDAYKRAQQDVMRARHAGTLEPEQEAQLAHERRALWAKLPPRVAAELEVWTLGWMTFGPRIVELEAQLERMHSGAPAIPSREP